MWREPSLLTLGTPRNFPVSDNESGETVEVVRVPTPKEDLEDPDGHAVRVGPGAGQLIDPLLATGADVKVIFLVG